MLCVSQFTDPLQQLMTALLHAQLQLTIATSRSACELALKEPGHTRVPGQLLLRHVVTAGAWACMILRAFKLQPREKATATALDLPEQLCIGGRRRQQELLQ